jgi:hypothetical protein
MGVKMSKLTKPELICKRNLEVNGKIEENACALCKLRKDKRLCWIKKEQAEIEDNRNLKDQHTKHPEDEGREGLHPLHPDSERKL